MPRRSPPPPPSSRDQLRNISPQSEEKQHIRHSHGTPEVNNGGGGSLGAFWSTQHAHESQVIEDNTTIFDDERNGQMASKNNANPERCRSVHGNTLKGFNDCPPDDFEINFSPEKASLHAETKQSSKETFNAFTANFDSASTINRGSRSGKEEKLEAEVDRLREQLRQANLERTEITSKYEKLSAICRSQRQELQELKQVIAASRPSLPRKDAPKTPETTQREKIEGTVWELQKGMFTSSPSPSPEPKQWQPFAEEPKPQASPKSVRAPNGHRTSSIKQPPASSTATDQWGFGHDSFRADPSEGSAISRSPAEGSSTAQRFGGGEARKAEASQPAGWAGF
ncbi:putative serine/threonine-protein kinase [Iris pallida]|uniref:non-specific serine/threonine protein kinase n=1 Tax=Iris pallida TaxID=29817 RepID=A0AAX6I7A7_IRIPA|nr:putative serine/threonine-protein kinase [Iris pallida]KAJ6849112.1 putative serine/threonine-protein kinase [Iris pallida]